jgi:hypothetical protein
LACSWHIWPVHGTFGLFIAHLACSWHIWPVHGTFGQLFVLFVVPFFFFFVQRICVGLM